MNLVACFLGLRLMSLGGLRCVTNHDTQLRPFVETPVEGLFMPLIYAFILL